MVTSSLITVDVEGHPDKRSYDSVDQLAKTLQSVEVQATLFVTPGVVEHKTDTVLNWIDDGHEIGLHIHPKRTPFGDSDWLTDYEKGTKADMISWGLNKFESNIDCLPNVFRAGRWEYSDSLLSVLSEFEFDIDSSLRPSNSTAPYRQNGVREIPLTVYENVVVRKLLHKHNISMIPMTIDAFLNKKLRTIGYYGVVGRLLISRPSYLMIAFHDYDVREEPLANRISQFMSRINSVTNPQTVSEL